jgi:hypothetical protein
MYLSLGYSFASLGLVSLASNPSFVSFSFLWLFVVSLYAWPVDGFVNSKSGSSSLLFKKIKSHVHPLDAEAGAISPFLKKKIYSEAIMLHDWSYQ